MRTTTHLLFAVAAFAAATTVSTIADAKPRKVVVVEFDGLPRNLADTGRANVMSLLGDQYELIPTKKWESARAQAQGRGPAQWQQAARSSGVDAVIEGWIGTEGRHHTLTVQIRDAATGAEIDNVSVKIGDKGLTSDTQHELSAQLDEVLNWIDGDVTSAGVGVNLPNVTSEPKLGSHEFPKKHDDDDEDDADARPRSRHHKARRSDRSDRDERRSDHSDRDDRDDRKSDDDKHADADDKDKARDSEAKPQLKQVAVADNPLVSFFPPDSHEADVVAEAKAPRIMKPAPKFLLSGGAFMASRGMSFEQNPPDSAKGAPDYPAQGLAGLAIAAQVYPMPINKLDSDPSGLGFSFALQKSVGSQFSAYDPGGNTYGDYTIDHTAYEAGIHYRYPTELLTVDGEVNYGKYGYIIQGLPGGVQIPDVDYTYLGIGGTLDLKVTERTRAGFGAHYMYLTDVGDVSDEMWYGAGTATGLNLEAHVQIPVSDMLYVRGQLDYRRVAMEFEQSGNVSYDLEVSKIVDSTIGATAVLGVQF